MKQVLIIFFLLYVNFCFSQINELNTDTILSYILNQREIDVSINNASKEETYYLDFIELDQTEKFNKLLELSKQLKLKKNYNQSIKILDYTLQQNNLSSAKRNDVYLLKASNFNTLGIYDSVSFYLSKIKTFSSYRQELEYKNLKADLLTNRGNYVESIKIYLSVLDNKQELNQKELFAVWKSLGVAYLKIKNFEKAKFYFKKLLNHEKDTNTIHRAEDHINIAVCYKEQDSLDKAGFHYLKSLVIAKAIDNDFLSAQVFSNLGNLEVRKKNFEKAKDFIDMSLQICKKHELKMGVTINKVNLSNLYIKKGDYDEAYEIINTIDVDFLNKSAPDLKTEFYKNRSLIYEQFNNTESALVDYKYYIKLIDSAYSIESLYKIKNIELESFEKQKLKEIEILENSIKDKKTRQIYLLILIFFLILILTLSYFVFKLEIRKKTLKNKVLSQQVELKNKEVLATVLKHNQYKEVRKKYVQEINQLINNNSNREKIKKYLKSIDYENNNFNWNEFDIYFKETHKSFFDNLIEKYPELTTNELRICALLKLNMNSKEISNLTSRSRGSIDNIRSSIRKKMQLEPDQNLSVYLNSFDN